MEIEFGASCSSSLTIFVCNNLLLLWMEIILINLMSVWKEVLPIVYFIFIIQHSTMYLFNIEFYLC